LSFVAGFFNRTIPAREVKGMPAKPSKYDTPIAGLISVICLIVVGVYGYGAADRFGWIPHSAQASVMFPSEGWESGEYISCFAVLSTENTVDLDCTRDIKTPGTIREMDVRFWGLVGNVSAPFTCQREQDSIICHLPKH
jgi:hypothetical protein